MAYPPREPIHPLRYCPKNWGFPLGGINSISDIHIISLNSFLTILPAPCTNFILDINYCCNAYRSLIYLIIYSKELRGDYWLIESGQSRSMFENRIGIRNDSPLSVVMGKVSSDMRSITDVLCILETLLFKNYSDSPDMLLLDNQQRIAESISSGK